MILLARFGLTGAAIGVHKHCTSAGNSSPPLPRVGQRIPMIVVNILLALSLSFAGQVRAARAKDTDTPPR